MTHFEDFDNRKADTILWARRHEHDADPTVREMARRVLRAHYLRVKPGRRLVCTERSQGLR